ncbi:tetratricopeptide repeat protein 19, mitochondrial [Eucyclogobius newberryi]|uniref:tetratricopeptide repeat protein 19, mitochondrial n=1 Tax=Eucyclogobius newberryi TaxID=166745 RepID=UPI003B5A8F48
MAACFCRALRTALAVTGRSARTGPNPTHAHRSVTRSVVQSAASPEWRQGQRRRRDRRQGGAVLWTALTFSLFGRSEEDERDEAQRKEDEMILLLKKAKLSIVRDQLSSASSFLHQALALAQQLHHQEALLYCYNLMANLSYVRGHLDHAEKLFKASLSVMLSRGTPENDNGVIETSLKLASIYSQQNKLDLAEHGFMFCVEKLEEKLEKLKEESSDESKEEQQRLLLDTRLLLGLVLDSRARFWTQTSDLVRAEQDYRRSLKICSQEQGPAHPQTLVLLSDLASLLDLQGNLPEALLLVQSAVDLGRTHHHPELHVLLCNLASILLHSGDLEAAARVYHEALTLAKSREDQETVEHIQEGLQELKSRRKERREEEKREEEKREESANEE